MIELIQIISTQIAVALARFNHINASGIFCENGFIELHRFVLVVQKFFFQFCQLKSCIVAEQIGGIRIAKVGKHFRSVVILPFL